MSDVVVIASTTYKTRAFSALCVYWTFGHHPHPLGYICTKCCFFSTIHCWARPWRKIMYSITHSLTQLSALLHPWALYKCCIIIITPHHCPVDDLSVGLSSAMWKKADRIRQSFGIIGRMGPGMRKVVGFGDRSTESGTFGANLGHAIVTNGDFTAYVSDSATTRPSSQITLSRLVIVWCPRNQSFCFGITAACNLLIFANCKMRCTISLWLALALGLRQWHSQVAQWCRGPAWSPCVTVKAARCWSSQTFLHLHNNSWK